MRFLADENFPRPVISRLRFEGHDVSWVGADLPSMNDKSILDRAEEEGRILLTLDRDFWQLALQAKTPLRESGVILFRVHPATPKQLGRLMRQVLELETAWNGQIALVTIDGIDIVRTR